MKLIVDFNGTQFVGNNMLQAIAAAGANTFIRVNTAQAVPIGTLISLIMAARGKNLSFDFNGAQLTSDSLQQTIDAATDNIAINIGFAHSIPIAKLIKAFSTAGNKTLSARFIGDQIFGDNLLQTIVAAGSNSSVSLSTAQAVPTPSLLAAIRASEGKHFSANFNGTQLNGDSIEQAAAAASMNTYISVNTAQATPIDTLLSILRIVGDKKFGADFNGAQLAGDGLEQAICSAGANTNISINTAQVITTPVLHTLIEIVGARLFSLDFNGAQLTGGSLELASSSFGQGTTINVKSADLAPINTLLSAMHAIESRLFKAGFDGTQLIVKDFKQAVEAAGTNTTISVNAAHALPITLILDAIATAG